MSEVISLDISKGWRPDLIPFTQAGGVVKATNLLPYDEGYLPAKNKSAYSTGAVTGTSIAAREYRNDTDGNFYVFIGTSSKLYRLEIDRSVTDISKTATDYSTGDNSWTFEKYGTWVIATNYIYAPQVLKGFTAANFQDLGGTPPKAKYCLLHSGHLLLAHLNEGGTIGPKKIACSAYDNIENYTVSLTTGAFSTVLEDADGHITGMVSLGNSFVIGHKNSLTIGYYVGRPYPFNFITNKIRNVGAIDGTLISVGNVCYFIGENDIYSFDGNSVTPLGFGVRRTISEILNFGLFYRFSVAHDAQNSIIYWGYSTTNTSTVLDRILCYNYKADKFTSIEVDHYNLFTFHTGQLLMDSIDTEFPSLDAIPYSMDSNYWLANSPVVGCIDNTTSKVATFTGTALTGILETGEINFKNRIHMVNRVRPKVQLSTDAVTVRVGTRFNEADSVVYSSSSTVGTNGYADLRASGRYGRIELTTGLHRGIAGIDIDVVDRGNR